MLLQILISIGVAGLILFAIVLLKKDKSSLSSGSGMGNAMQAVHEIFEPEMKHAVEIKQKNHVVQDDSGTAEK
ncbi:MAG: hypothetical protein JW768_10145 [Chitinispirillaceae bacterium]|nr:hypothetical protein [Chitinispirillaceae bacterium]